MLRVKQSFMIYVLLVSLSACGPQPPAPVFSATPFAGTEEAFVSPTPWVGGTETALAFSNASPTPWIAGTETALALLSASPTPPPLPTFALPALSPFPTFTPLPLPEGTFTPVFYGTGPFLLVGGVKQDHGWLSGVQAAQFINNVMDYDFYSPNGSTQVRGSALEFSPTCQNHYMNSAITMSEPMVGVASGWISEKRATRDLSTDDPSYTQAVAEWFQSQGNSPAEIQITRILQADLEGDGVNEILLSASYFSEKLPLLSETGDYSVVLMRKVVGNDVLTVPLVKDYYVSSVPEIEISYPYTYTLAEALDLNGDGTLEVVVDVSRWEGGGAIVYRVDGLNVREVMRVIC